MFSSQRHPSNSERNLVRIAPSMWPSIGSFTTEPAEKIRGLFGGRTLALSRRNLADHGRHSPSQPLACNRIRFP